MYRSLRRRGGGVGYDRIRSGRRLGLVMKGRTMINKAFPTRTRSQERVYRSNRYTGVYAFAEVETAYTL
jgi:hypothetical protein